MNDNETFSERMGKLAQIAQNVLILLEALDRIAAKIAGAVNMCNTKSQQSKNSNTTNDSGSSDIRFFY
jgi:hypothetical protein